MLATYPGSFLCYVPKSPSLFGSLWSSRSGAEQAVHERLDRYSEATARRRHAHQAVTSTPGTRVQKFVYPGGGLTVHPGIQPITAELIRVTPYVQQSKDFIVVFFGTLINLQDLWSTLRQSPGARPPMPSDAGTGALTTACILGLYTTFDNGRELLMLSELQGQYAFVLYDSVKKQALAARDPSGAEPLYYKVDSDGGVQYTNSLAHLPPGDPDRRAWKELPPGHYMIGKTVAQFALSLRQLERRERQESQDAEALHWSLQQEEQRAEEGERGGGGLGAVRALLRNRSK